jgi:hypothetical protein
MSKQLCLKEVLNLDFFDYTTGDAKFRLDYCTETTVSTSSERIMVTGGQGNYRLTHFDHTRLSTCKIVAPVVDLELVGKMFGIDLATGAVNVPKREILTTSGATPTITLAATPVSGTLQVFKVSTRDLDTEQTVGTPASQENTYSGTTTLTLNATSCPAGTVLAVYYDYSAPATTQKIVCSASKFPGYYRVVGTGIATDITTGETDVPVVFELLKASPKPDATFTLSSTNPTTLEFDLDLFTVLNTTSNEYEYFRMFVLAD